MKFIIDCMLGKLAKWLKIFGFDVLYFPKIEDGELLALTQKEKRTLLTRDNALLQKAKGIKSLFIESEKWEEQVGQVLEEFNLWKDADPYSRCIECNSELKNLSKSKAKNLVTAYVYEHAKSFAICPQCGRVFWQGTHFKDMKAKIEGILKKKRTGAIRGHKT
jgi:uncharacterized protein with PIN domain